jgi:phage gp36-like protein
MSGNTFTEAVELAYAECWRQGEHLEDIASGKVKYGDESEEDQAAAYDRYWRESLGAAKVLGALLVVQGEVGTRTFPVNLDEALPDSQQVWIRLMQWGIRKGLTTQAKLDQAMEDAPQLKDALRYLGQNRRPSEADLKALAELQTGRTRNG